MGRARNTAPKGRVKHPHEGRLAELYVRDGLKLTWAGYLAGPVPFADWEEDLKAWVHTVSRSCTPSTRGKSLGNVPATPHTA